MIHRDRRAYDPKSWHEPEISMYPTTDGFEIAVGYHIDKTWYPCAYTFAYTERSARRKARRLLRWYRRYAERRDRARELEAELNV